MAPRKPATDAEAIREAALRPASSGSAPADRTIRGIAQRRGTRFVPVKSEETRGAATVFRIRELLIRQRTQAINALRGHLAEVGPVVPQGAANAARRIALVEGPDNGLPTPSRP